jgi:hypothetical protein
MLVGFVVMAALLVPTSLRAESDDRASSSPDRSPPSHDPYAPSTNDLSNSYMPEGEPLEEERETPDYDARSESPPSVGDIALWVPRIALFPVHLVLEYGLRWPVGQTTSLLERRGLVEPGLTRLYDPSGPQLGVAPILKIKSERASIFGASLFYRGAFEDTVDLGLDVAGFPGRNFLVRSHLRRRFPPEQLALSLHVATQYRDDHGFWGLGPDVRPEVAHRYSRYDTSAHLRFEAGPRDRGTGGHLDIGFSDHVLRCSPHLSTDLCGRDGIDGTSDDRYDLETPDLAPFMEDYTLARLRTRLYWDTRSDPNRGDGLRLELMGGWSHSIGPNSPRLNFLSYGAEAGGFWNIFGLRDHTLGLRLRTELVHPLGRGLVPIPELPVLGGDETMRGFSDDQFRGLSTVMATLDYRYPVWSFLNGVVFLEVGNAFGRHFRGFEPGRLRGTAGIGVQSFGLLTDYTSFNFNVAIGTTPLGSDDFGVETIEVNGGTNWGF